jgi:glycerol-3-phosphate acyltransferase PlsY
VAVAPIAALLLRGSSLAALVLVVAALVWFKHAENIRRLLAGTEPRLGQSRKSA